jgi:hypothetical protein
MKIIGVAGQLQNGKDSTADALAPELNRARIDDRWTRISFARRLKRIFCETFGVDLEFVEKWKVIDQIPPGFDCTVREALINIGDNFRKIRGTVWIDLAMQEAGNKPSICSDVRYINELRKVSETGGMNILVWRPGRENDIPNRSESELRPIVDYYVGLIKTGLFRGYVPKEKVPNTPKPAGAEYIDLFLCNDGSLDDLRQKVAGVVAPMVERKFNNDRV